MKSKLGVALSVCLFAGLAQAQRLEFTNPDGMSTPANYTQVVKAGKLLFIAGQTARTADGQILDVGMKEQLEQIMINLETALKSQGADFTNVAKITTYVTSMHEYRKPEVAAVRTKYFGNHKPASTSMEIVQLANPAYRVEVEVIAVLP